MKVWLSVLYCSFFLIIILLIDGNDKEVNKKEDANSSLEEINMDLSQYFGHQ